MARTHRGPVQRSVGALLVLAVLASLVALLTAPRVGAQESYQRISGEGSSWSANAIDAMRVNVRQFGIVVDYNPSGSTSGRRNYLNGIVDFAASDIPFQFNPEDGSPPENPAPDSYAYVPVTAGGTSFMYNLKIAGQQVTNLRLSGENVAKIFTGEITQWNDPALQSDNPGIELPNRTIVPVVRSDGSGSSAHFTEWMIDQHPSIWNDYCSRSGRAPACGFTSFYPTIPGMIAQAGDLGVAGYVSQGFAEGSIGYVNYSYALGVQFPVVKVLNAAGFYTEPTPENVAVSLLQARISTDISDPATYLTQELEGVYADTDPRNYPLSSYSYFILPTVVAGQFNEAKGRTLGAFAYYAMCQAQQQSASLGYSPLPINLVEASFDQIRKIPGVEVQDISVQDCNNPTFSPDGTNLLAANAPMPKECDRQGASQCADGTAGMRNTPTAVRNPPTQAEAPTAETPADTPGTTPGTSGPTEPAAAPVAGDAPTTPAAGGPEAPTGGTGTPPDSSGTPSGDAVVGGDGSQQDVAAPLADPTVVTDSGVVAAPATPVAAPAGDVGPVTAVQLPRSPASAPLTFLIALLLLAVVIVPVMLWRNLGSTSARSHG